MMNIGLDCNVKKDDEYDLDQIKLFDCKVKKHDGCDLDHVRFNYLIVKSKNMMNIGLGYKIAG